METKTSIIYARVSTVAQDYERQVSDLQAYARGNGYHVERIFCEKISGAKKNSERPELMAALDYALSHKCAILCSELSRLGRSTWEVLESVKECRDKHVNIIFQKEGLRIFNDDSTESVMLPVIISCLGMSAQLEREAIRFRMKSGYEHYRANGNKVGRKNGYRVGIEHYETKYPKLVNDLRKKIKCNLRGDKYSVRYLAGEHGVNESTVQAIVKIIKDEMKKKEAALV